MRIFRRHFEGIITKMLQVAWCIGILEMSSNINDVNNVKVTEIKNVPNLRVKFSRKFGGIIII